MNSELQTLVSLDTLTNIPDEAAQEIISLLRTGIEAAKNGSRDEAKALLFRVTDIDPDNEMAWLWLASVSEYPEELLTFLQKVLNINPANEQALEWEKSTKALLARNLVQYGITAVQENKKESAKRCFLRAIETDENNEMAWLWMASITEDQDEKSAHLEKVLAINPENEVANTLLKIQRKDEAQDLLQKSKASAVRGNRQEALEMLEQIKQLDSETDEVWILQAHLSESFEEKAFCFNQALACNPENEAARFGLASLESILQAVNGNGNSHSNGTASLLSPELEEELNAVHDTEDTVIDQSFSAEETEEKVFVEEEMSAPEAFFTPQEAEEVEETAVAEETVADEPENAFPSFSAHMNEPEELTETEQHSFDATTGDLDQDLIASEPAASVFEDITAEMEAETETATENETEDEPVASYFTESAAEEADEPAASYFAESSEEEAEEPVASYFAENAAEEAAEELEEAQPAPSFFTESSEVEEEVQAAAPSYFEESPEAEEAPENIVEESMNAQPETLAVEKEETEQEITAETFYFGQDDIENTVDSLIETKQDNDETPFAETEGSATPEDSSEVVEEVNEEMQLSHATADQAPFAQMSDCPFCGVENNINDEVCTGCNAVMGLHNMDMLLSHVGVDKEKLSQAVESMESNLEADSFSAEEYFTLGLACLNLKDLDNGLNYLQRSYILNPTHSFLKSQIDELAKRVGKNEDAIVEGMGSGVAGKTIMVVDDSATIRKLVSAKLEKHGHNVVAAVDGMDALAKLEEIVPDLILLDITMPRLDGYQVCKLIRANENTRFVPIVLISGKDGFFDKVRGKMCGSTTYITKPFGPEMLLRTVEEYFQ
ncbi:MAG TPA: response regulator [Pyrinomonadaceae bacterium]|jgi:CheY-like chemotaxis protein|nr:response regulator [Pyrinomonadaceae bacterium]